MNTWSMDSPRMEGGDGADWKTWIVRNGSNATTHCLIQFGSAGINHDEALQLVLSMIGGLNEHERRLAALHAAAKAPHI